MKPEYDFESTGYVPLSQVDEIIERSKLDSEVVLYSPPKPAHTPTEEPIPYQRIVKGLVLVTGIAGGVYVAVQGFIALGAAVVLFIQTYTMQLGGGALACLILYFANEGRKEASATDEKTTGGGNHYHYYQNNSFGGNAEQNNSK